MKQETDVAQQQKEKLKKKNLLVGWAIGLFAIGFYVFAIYFK